MIRSMIGGLAGAVLCLVLSVSPSADAGSASRSPEFTGECAVFFERGHYWIELGLAQDTDAGALEGIDRRDFTVTDVSSGESFNPSRVEISGPRGAMFVVLSSGKLKGRRCYEVSFVPAVGGAADLGQACDPAGRDPSPSGGRAAELFRDHIAPSFSAGGEEYRFNRLSVGYDFTAEETSSELIIEPVFGGHGLSLSPYLMHDATTYMTSGGSERSVSRMRAGVGAAARRWTGAVRLSLEGIYAYDRESPAVEEPRTASSARVLAIVRFDNLFDSINRHGASVFKGIDVGGGYAWYDSTEAGSSMSLGGPLLAARLTWTLAASLQVSLGTEVCWPDGEERAHSWNRARVRLLLRDALAGPKGRSYHPDLELAIDWGRRLPFFEREERISLGFTFDLYPWR